MAKTQEKLSEVKEAKNKKETKDDNGGALIGRVKKVIKKSRRKMGEEKFEKQLQRTIAFLEELQRRTGEAANTKSEKKAKPVPKDNGKSKVKKAVKKGSKRDRAKTKSKAAAISQSELTAGK